MEYRSETLDNCVVFYVSGRVDATTSGPLEEVLMDCIADGNSRILVDMADVDYISSAGLRVLLAITKKLYGKGQFALSRLSDNVKEIIDMAGFSNFMAIYDSIDTAQAGMSAV